MTKYFYFSRLTNRGEKKMVKTPQNPHAYFQVLVDCPSIPVADDWFIVRC